jgi:hypothetical protein
MSYNPWMLHLQNVRNKNPRLSLKEAMILAKKSCTPKKKKGK